MLASSITQLTTRIQRYGVRPSVYNFEEKFQRYSSSGPYQGAKRKLLAFLISLWTCRDRHLIYAITISLFKTDSWKVNLRHGSFIAEWLVCYQLLPLCLWAGHLYMWDLVYKFLTYQIPEEERELLAFMHSRLTEKWSRCTRSPSTDIERRVERDLLYIIGDFPGYFSTHIGARKQVAKMVEVTSALGGRGLSTTADWIRGCSNG